MTTDAPTEDQRARWLKHPLRKIHYSEVEYIDLCAAITADAVQAERARLAASGEMTDEEVMALVEAHAYRKHDNSFEMTEGEARTLVRALLASERDRETLAERGRCARWQPIETAPRDGTVILLNWGQDGTSAGFYDLKTPFYPWRFIDRDTTGPIIKNARTGIYGPTHWMPLPAGPSAVVHRAGEAE